MAPQDYNPNLNPAVTLTLTEALTLHVGTTSDQFSKTLFRI